MSEKSSGFQGTMRMVGVEGARMLAAASMMLIASCGSSVQVADGTSAGDGGGAGSGGSGGSGGSSPSPGTCADWARGYCSYFARCMPHGMAIEFSNEVLCRERKAHTCETRFLTADSDATPEWLGGCGRAFEAATCDAPAASCYRPPGRRLPGASCGGDEQCADGFCQTGQSGGCGVCQTYMAAGEVCVPFTIGCEPSLHCAYLDNRCVPWKGLGATCDDTEQTEPCFPTTWCSAGKCVPFLTVGMTCDPEQDVCDAGRMLMCEKQSHTCVAVRMPEPGETCGPPGPDVGCVGSFCDGSKCGESIREGAACTLPDDRCVGWGLRCITGHCAIPVLPQCN